MRKIFDKYYFSINQVLKTDDVKIIGKYIEQLYISSKKISNENLKKLVDKVIEKADPILINKTMILIKNKKTNKDIERESLDKLTNAIIKTNNIEDMLNFKYVTNKISLEVQDKLIDAIIKSQTKAYYEFSKGNLHAYYKCRSNEKTEYIYNFICIAKGLEERNINKLADYMIKTKNIKYVVSFFKNIEISEEKILELEKYILEFYSKIELARFLNEFNNEKLISLIYGDKNKLNQFLTDYQKCDDKITNFKREQYRQAYGNVGSIKKTSGFIPNEQIQVMAFAQKSLEELSTKYKYVDDNIQKVLNSDLYNKVIDDNSLQRTSDLTETMNTQNNKTKILVLNR